jgi:ribosomal protein S12 methylthiotransferase accessory factor YcaO
VFQFRPADFQVVAVQEALLVKYFPVQVVLVLLALGLPVILVTLVEAGLSQFLVGLALGIQRFAKSDLQPD